MGADLITFILIGPKKLEPLPSHRESVVRRVMDKRKAALEGACRGLAEARGLSPEQLRQTADFEDALEDFLRNEGGGEECLVHLTPEEVRKTLDALVALWNDGSARDLDWRLWKDGRKTRRLVVAGDMSYGDEPDGYAFQLFKKAQGMGLMAALGIE
jgi:hypothetical protein